MSEGRWRQTHGLLYIGDRYAGRMSTTDLADKVVDAMNARERERQSDASPAAEGTKEET